MPLCSMSKMAKSAPARARTADNPSVKNSKAMVPKAVPPASSAARTGLGRIRGFMVSACSSRCSSNEGRPRKVPARCNRLNRSLERSIVSEHEVRADPVMSLWELKVNV
jgi:hypothetical protein